MLCTFLNHDVKVNPSASNYADRNVLVFIMKSLYEYEL